jgi:CDP-paratose 2-epimerase
LDAYDAAFAAGEQAIGKAFNIGGGPQNVLSLLELLRYIEERQGRKLSCRFADWRPGDQKVFVSDIHRSQSELGWKPRTDCIRGLGLLYDWISQNHDLFAAPVTAEA